MERGKAHVQRGESRLTASSSLLESELDSATGAGAATLADFLLALTTGAASSSEEESLESSESLLESVSALISWLRGESFAALADLEALTGATTTALTEGVDLDFLLEEAFSILGAAAAGLATLVDDFPMVDDLRNKGVKRRVGGGRKISAKE